MSRNGLKCAFSPVTLLSPEQEAQVDQTTRDVLANVGVTVEDAEMRKTLRDFGARVDEGLNRVYFDSEVIQRAIELSPAEFEGTARDAANNVRFASGKNTLFLNACGTNYYDDRNNCVRPATRKEFYDYIRVIDSLPNVDIQNCFPLFGFENVPECMKLLESVAAKYRVSTKAQIEGTVFDNYRFSTEMAKAVGVDLFQIVNSAAPLTYYRETAEQLRVYTEAGLPVHFAAGPTRGLTCPMTSVGAVVSNNAESLAGVVMAQALRPNTRVWINSMIMTPDMKTLRVGYGDIGNSITDAVFNQMWRRYRIPSWSNAAAWTSSKTLDYQAAYESTMALMTQVMTGATAISFQGGMYASNYVNPLKAIIDDDIVGMVARFAQGVTVDEESLAYDLIKEIGPIPGSFMNTDLTFDTYRDECYNPRVADRRTLGSAPSSDMLERARAEMEKILSKPVEALSASQEDAIEQILKEARQHYYRKGLISEEEWNLYQKDLASPNYPFA